MNENMQRQWSCLRCQSQNFEKDYIRTTGNGLSRFFDVQNKKFLAITCTQCGHTELFKENVGVASSVLDFFLGG